MNRQPTHPIHDQFIDRWSPRAFDGTPLPEATLLRFLEAARWAPSASNLQPWRFVYALAGTPAFDALLGALVPFNQAWARGAAALVAVCSQPVAQGSSGKPRPNAWHAFDTGAAWMSLALQAHADGWATHGMGGFEADKVRAALGIPEAVAVHAVVAIGRRGDPAQLADDLRAREQPSDRQPLASIACANRWSLD